MNNFKKNIYKSSIESTPPLPIYYEVEISTFSDDLTSTDACTNQLDISSIKYHSGELVDPIVGDTIFNDINGLTNFNGNAYFWKFDSDGVGFSAMKISTVGEVIEIDVCP